VAGAVDKAPWPIILLAAKFGAMEDRTTITEGQDRLTLEYDEGYFRALIWSCEHGREWRCRVVITQADFQRDSDRERWVSALHSFDPVSGRAIIKVGEMEAPLPNGFELCIYSWREWDLLANRELQTLRVCEDPCEEYGVPLKVHKAIAKADQDSVVIDCNFEDWDGCLYNCLDGRRRIELRNLHASYEHFLKQLAEPFCMEFVGDFTNNRGEFKQQTLPQAGLQGG
jgi:hypothetical protein